MVNDRILHSIVEKNHNAYSSNFRILTPKELKGVIEDLKQNIFSNRVETFVFWRARY